jgi:hypothetical protein
MIKDIINENENEMKPNITGFRIHIIILIIIIIVVLLLISRPIILAIWANPELSLPQEPKPSVVPKVEEIICSMNKKGQEYARLTQAYNLPNRAQEIEINPSIKWQSVTIFIVGTLIFYIAANYFP